MAGFSYGTYLSVFPLGARHSFSYGLASFTLKRKARMGKRKGGRGREGTERKGTGGEGECVEPTMSPCTEVLELCHTKSLSSGSL